jgi:hypothetical protein
METPGRAVAAMIYCSALVYEWGEKNPVIDFPTTGVNFGGLLPLWEDDCRILHQGWLDGNVEFIRSVLTADFVFAAVERALDVLAEQPEYSILIRLQSDMPARRELIESRVAQLPDRLKKQDAFEWTV